MLASSYSEKDATIAKMSPSEKSIPPPVDGIAHVPFLIIRDVTDQMFDFVSNQGQVIVFP